MATVTGLTKDRMVAIEAASVVSGTIDDRGHLILTKHDGSTIDAGSALPALPIASTTQQGIVELATDTETSARTDATKAVTPSSLTSTINNIDNSLSNLDSRVHTLETAPAPDPASLGITGEIRMWAGTSVPSGWQLCDGSPIDRTTYSKLYGIIGTTYGAGDGSTTFNVPNLKGRVPTGYDSSQTEFNTLGKTGGEKTHILTTAEVPSHTHSLTVAYSNTTPLNYASYPSGYNPSNTGTGTASGSISSSGGDGAHNNLQPYVVLNYIIKL